MIKSVCLSCSTVNRKFIDHAQRGSPQVYTGTFSILDHVAEMDDMSEMLS
jgi:hypothetical protein